MAPVSKPVVHLELHTGNLPSACSFATELFGWRAETVTVGASSYLALGIGHGIEGGVVEHDTDQSLWLPYVQVPDIADASRRALGLGATVILEPREGPAGWRSVITSQTLGAIALWQPKQ